LVVEYHQKRLPYRRLAVGWISLSTACDRGNKAPAEAAVFRGVDINLSDAEISWNRVPGEKNGSFGEVSDGLGQDVKSRLISQTPSVLLVGDVGVVGPVYSAIGAPVDGKIHKRWFWRVVLPIRIVSLFS
jgi:hypothetical protein